MNPNDLKQATDGLQILKDPFLKECVKGVHAHAIKKLFGDGWSYVGKIEFENGDTKGEQSFKGETFADVIKQMERFVETL